MDIQPKSNQGFVKPIGGLIVILLVALLVGGWLYVDIVRNELETKIDTLSAQIDVARSQLSLPTYEASKTAKFNDGGFTFEYPDRLGGPFTCMNAGTAYFGYSIEKLTRSWMTDGPSYQYEFWDAKPLPDNAGDKPFQAVLMKMEPTEAGGPICFVRLVEGSLSKEESNALLQSIQPK